MKNLILVSLFFIIACDTVVEKDLYTRFDREYDLAQQLQVRECTDSSTFLQTARRYIEFDDAPYEVGDTYRVSQDDNTATLFFVRIMAINASDMMLRYASVGDASSELVKDVIFTQANNETLVDEIFTQILCSPTLESRNFTSSGLSSDTQARFIWEKQTVGTPDNDDDNIPDITDSQTDSLTINLNYPLFFYFYNGEKVRTRQDLADVAATTSTSNITITELTEAECMADSRCDFSVDQTDCTLSINEAPLDLALDETSVGGSNVPNEPDANFLSLTGTSCNLLESSN